MSIKVDVLGRYIEGEVTVVFKAYLDKDTVNLLHEEAIELLKSELNYISNFDSISELLQTSIIKLIKT